MKKIFTLIMLVASLFASAQHSIIPDDAFETYCELMGWGDNKQNDTVMTAQIELVTNLTVANLPISDMTGIEDFTALQVLDVSGTNLSDYVTGLDLSSFDLNTNLSTLICFNNPDLHCIEVNSIGFANFRVNAGDWTIDSTMSFSNDCANAFGCLDSLACNYDPLASIDTAANGSCFYSEFFPISDTVCDLYLFGDSILLDTTGIYYDTLTTIGGCDSVVELNLFVKYSTESHTFDTVCDATIWNSVIYDTSGVFAYNDTNMVGCDSTAYLHLIVNYSQTTSSALTACDNYTWDGTTYNISGNYSKLYSDINGCDSTHTLNLTINYSNTGVSNITACDSFIWPGSLVDNIPDSTYLVSGIYTNTYTNIAGCDSVHTLNLTINYLQTTSSSVTSCDDYTWDGVLYDSTGIYSNLYTDVNGCDSTHTLNLTINYSDITSSWDSICDSYTWIDHQTGNTIATITQSGPYTHTFTNLAGCDSTHTLNALVFNSSSSTQNVTECENYTVDGNFYDTTGIYYYALPEANMYGCDSIITLNLTINYDDTSMTYMGLVCSGPFSWNNQLIDSTSVANQGGIFTHFTSTTLGCDSIATLSVSVGRIDSMMNVVSSCDDYTWFDANGDTINTYVWSAGQTTYQDSVIYTNLTGCDSTVYLDLTIYQTVLPSNTPYEYYDCSDGWTGPDGNIYDNNQSGNLGIVGYNQYSIVNGQTAQGCDILEYFNVYIAPDKDYELVTMACDSFYWDTLVGGTGQWYYTSTMDTVSHIIYIDHPTLIDTVTNLPVSFACDSTFYLDLTINYAQSTTSSVIACDSYTWDGVTYDTTGTYSNLYTDINNCDSTHTLNLTINYSNTGVSNITTCDSFTWPGSSFDNIPDVTYFVSGVYTNIYTNAAGCDSTHTLNLTINYSDSIPPTILTTIIACDTWSWTDDFPGSPIGNATFTTSGLKGVTFLNQFGCDSTVWVDLTIDHTHNIVDYYDVCDSLVWRDGNTYYTSNNTATYTYATTVGGCDSIYYLDLTIRNSNFGSTNLTVCDSFTWPGSSIDNIPDSTYLVSGIYTNTYTNAVGCDSVHTLNLTVNYSTSGTSADTSCDSYIWVEANNMLITSSGLYPFTFTNAAGCDSIHVLEMTIIPTGIFVIDTTVCHSFYWDTFQTTLDSTNQYQGVLPNSCGGFDTLILNLTVHKRVFGSGSLIACDSYTWGTLGNNDGNGVTYDSSGIYVDTLISSVGCDSIATLNLTVNYSSYDTTNLLIACDTLLYYTLDSNRVDTFMTTGAHTLVLPNANIVGCDSIITVNVNILESTYSDTTATVCDSVSWNGDMYYTTGTHSFRIENGNAVGCDTTARLHLTVNNSYELDVFQQSCDSIVWNNQTYTQSGIYTQSWTANNTCDSIVHLNLTIGGLAGCTDTMACNYDPFALCDDGSCVVIYGCTDPSACNFDNTACVDDGSCLTIYGCMDSTAFNYDPLAQCDDGSCIPVVYGCTNPSACNYDPTANTDDGSCLTIYGCMDSTMFNFNPLAVCDDSSCIPFIYGCTDPSACNYVDTANTDDGSCLYIYGCMDTLACNYDPLAECPDNSCNYSSVYNLPDTVVNCGPYTWIDGSGLTITQSGNYSHTISVNGCDSTIILTAIINDIPVISADQDASNPMIWVVTPGGPYASYNWIGPNGFSSSDPTIEPGVNGIYCVQVTTDDGCSSDSTCFSVTYLPSSLDEISLSEFKVYPNPTTDYISVEFTLDRISDYTVKVLSSSGTEVYKDDLYNFSGDYKGKINLSNYSKGIYFVEISYEDRIIFKKVVLQ